MHRVSRVRCAAIQIRRGNRAIARDDALATVPCFGMELLERRILYTAGDLDPSFDGDGWASTTHRDHAGWPTGINYITDLLVQPDGRSVVLGHADSHTKIGLYRYNADGSLDTTFGDGGRVLTDVSPKNDHGDALALLPDGKYLVSGSSQAQDHRLVFTVLRYNAHGSLDTTFGDGGSGVLVRDFSMQHGDGRAIVVAADGAITIAGSGLRDESATQDVMLVRLTPDGALDESFGDGGRVLVDYGAADRAVDLQLTANGSVLVLAQSHIEGQKAEPSYVVRFNADGSLDTTFGDGGRVLIDFGHGYEGTTTRELTLLDDGRFVIGGGVHDGYYWDYAPHLAAARYHADGSPDTSFGDGGVAIVIGEDLLVDSAYLAVRTDGSIVLAGTRRVLDFDPNNPPFDIVVALLNADGKLDPTFGDSGITVSDFGGQEGVFGLAVTPSGNIVVAANNQQHDVILARYDGGLAAEPPAPASPPAERPATEPPAAPVPPERPSEQPVFTVRTADRFFELNPDARSAFSLLTTASSDLLDGDADEDELLVDPTAG